MDEVMGWEACLALEFLTAVESEGLFGEGRVDYAGALEEMDAAQLLAVVREASRLLEQLMAAGDLPPETPDGNLTIQDLFITSHFRIFIGQVSASRELLLRPMCKAVFLLFLSHPEGISFRNLPAYRNELARLYGRVSRQDDPEKIRRSIDRIIDLKTNEMNVNISRIADGLSLHVDDRILSKYVVSGRAGRTKTIPLQRTHVHWLQD